MRLRVLPLLIMICVAALVNPGAAAFVSVDEPRPVPARAVAYWSFDPSRLGMESGDPNLSLIHRGLSLLLENLLVLEPDGLTPAGVLLAPESLGARPYRLILLDVGLEAAPEPAAGAPARLARLAAVLEITGGAADAERKVIEASKEIAGVRGRELTEAEMTLPDGTTAKSLSIADADDRFQIFLARSRDTLVVGIGPRSLELFFARERGEPRFERHRVALKPASEPSLEAYIDLDRLRELIPDEVGWGRTADLLHAWRIANARDVMVAVVPAAQEARHVGLLDVAVSWSSRAEPMQAVHTARLSIGEWPGSIGPPPEGVRYSVVLQAVWLNWMTMGIRTYAALSPDDRTFGNRANQWLLRSLPALERVVAQTQFYVVMQGPDADGAGVSLRVPFKRRAPMQRVESDLQQVFGGLPPIVAYSPQERLWTINAGNYAIFYLGIRGEELLGSRNKADLRLAPKP